MSKISWVTKAGAVFSLCVVTAIATPAQTFTTLHSFCVSGYPCRDGAQPDVGLVQGTDGNLYGTTQLGGPNNNAGVVFKITVGGTETVLYNFCSQGGVSCTDGSIPTGLVQSTNGKYYGTTLDGGVNCSNCGTVFSVTAGGELTTIHSFASTDGALPYGGWSKPRMGSSTG